MSDQTKASDFGTIKTLTHIATTASMAVQAISDQRDDEARELIDRLRGQRARALGADQVVAERVRLSTTEGLEALQHGSEVLAICNEVITQWNRSGYEAALHQEGALGVREWHQVLDHLLPLCWNFRADIFVVFGQLPTDLLQALRERGQQRVVLFGSRGPETKASCIVQVKDLEALNAFLSSIESPFPSLHVSLDLAAAQMTPDDLEATDIAIARLIANLRSAWVTWYKASPTWLRQGLDNLSRIARSPDISQLASRFTGRPAIVISPGPSLDKNIAHLREAQGKALLLAPLQVLRRLHREGIRPDFAVVLDALDQTQGIHDFLSGIDPAFLPDLLACTSAHPNVLKVFPRVFFFSSNSPVDQITVLAHRPRMPMLLAGSVAIACFNLAVAWHCSPVVLVGQDLSFAGSRQYAQATGTVKPLPKASKTLPGYHGGTVETDVHYALFHLQFELLAAKVRKAHSHQRLYNCTEGGASIAGFDQRPLRTVIEREVMALKPLSHTSEIEYPKVVGLDQRLLTSLLQFRSQVQETRGKAERRMTQLQMRMSSGAFSKTQLSAEDQNLLLAIKNIRSVMAESAGALEKAQIEWDAFTDLQTYVDGFCSYFLAACEGMRGLESRLAPAIDALEASMSTAV